MDNKYHFEDLDSSSEYKTIQQIENAVNSFGWNPRKFAACIPTMHRTLQQKLFRTILEVIEFMSSDEYMTDGRNQASKEMAKKIVDTGVLKDLYIPLI